MTLATRATLNSLLTQKAEQNIRFAEQKSDLNKPITLEEVNEAVRILQS